MNLEYGYNYEIIGVFDEETNEAGTYYVPYYNSDPYVEM